MNKHEFENFFRPYSKNVDKAAGASSFWRLSDTIIMEIIRLEIAPYCTDESLVMDAGGGTGRWAVKLSGILKGKIVVFDRSTDMLAKASENIKHSHVSDRIDIVEGDLTNIESFAEESVDHILSIYSPLSFIYEQTRAAQELFRVLKPGGRILIMSHAHFNAIASKINNYNSSPEELKKLAGTRVVKWAPYVPELITHSKESIEQLFSGAGFNVLKTYGIPAFVQPGPEDFDPDNKQKSHVSDYLDDPKIFSAIFDIEMKYNSLDTVANRGMNIFLLANKE